jgi:predicted DNA-binding protein (UPF0251 family)
MHVQLICMGMNMGVSQSKCWHLIGSSRNKTVCIVVKAKGAKMCSTRHQDDEVVLEANVLYIRVA